MNKKYFFSFTMFLSFLIACLAWSGPAQAAEDVSITHTVTGYVSDGPTATITMNLQLKNNSGSVINGLTVKPAPIPKDLLFNETENFEPLSLGNIAVGGMASGDYTISNHSTLPKDVIESLPILWEVRYLDGAGQEQGNITASYTSTGGEGL